MRIMLLVSCLLALVTGAASPRQDTTVHPTPELPDKVSQQFEANLRAAEDRYQSEPTADNLIWVGRRLAYLGRYQDAIDMFTRGIEEYPDDARFLRHRGHRHITTRQFDRAVDDLARAARMETGKSDRVEPDGLPNAQGIPTSTLHTNIYYHLGLAHFLQADYSNALLAWLACLEASRNPDMEAATRYWIYLTQMRLGYTRAAQDTLNAVDTQWDLIENEGYFELLLLFRGDRTLEDVLPGGDLDLKDITRQYGIAQWLRHQGRLSEYKAQIEAILDSNQTSAFAFIAAEAEHSR